VVNKAAVAKKQHVDVVKAQILKFLKVLAFVKPEVQRLSNQALKAFADANEQTLYPHMAHVSAQRKEPEAVINALTKAYEGRETVQWTSNSKSPHGNHKVMKYLRSFATFAAQPPEVPRRETEVDAQPQAVSFASLFAGAAPAVENDTADDDEDEGEDGEDGEDDEDDEDGEDGDVDGVDDY
jgi:hypothetical protein